MSEDATDRAALRHAVYALLILATLVQVTGRVLTARARDGHTPFFSANDRSRWSTISALVDFGGYEIDEVRRRPGWKSIDMVRHRGRDGNLHYYSSKPPLLSTLLAPLYWTIRATTGWTFADQPFAVARLMLLVTNVLPFALYLVLMTIWIERQSDSDFGRIFLVACACWGTLLTPFVATLNNHLPAAIGVLLSTLCLWRIWNQAEPQPGLMIGAGLAAGFAATSELPALAFLLAVGAALAWHSPRQTLCYFLPAVLLVALAFFAVNYAAHGSLRPPYAHRAAGENWYDYPGSYWMTGRQGVDLGEPSKWVYLFHVLVGHHGFFSLTPIWCLSLVGALLGWRQGDARQRLLVALTLGLTTVCVVFYVALRPLGDRNYGGVAAGFRWLFWLIPLWLMMLRPAADRLEDRRLWQVLGFLLLAVSMLSAAIPAGNPWTHPWIYQLMSGGTL
jgi:hypothetical protein